MQKVLFILTIVLSQSGWAVQTPLMKQSAEALRQAHQVFAESWRLLMGLDQSSGNSMMKAVSQRLNKMPEPCLGKNKSFSERFREEKNGATSTLVLERGKCGSKDWNVIAQIAWSSHLRHFEFIAVPSAFSEVVGDSVAILNVKLRCQGDVNKEIHLEEFSCQDLMQGTTRSEHVAFKVFNYSARKTQMLTVKADSYQNLMTRKLCDSVEPCLQLSVPLAGKAHILEDHRSSKALPVAPVVPAAKATEITSVKNKENPQDENQKIETEKDQQNSTQSEKEANEEVVGQSEGQNAGQASSQPGTPGSQPGAAVDTRDAIPAAPAQR